MTKEEVSAFVSHLLNGVLNAQVLLLQLRESANSDPGEGGHSETIYVDDSELLGDRMDSGVVPEVRLNRSAMEAVNGTLVVVTLSNYNLNSRGQAVKLVSAHSHCFRSRGARVEHIPADEDSISVISVRVVNNLGKSVVRLKPGCIGASLGIPPTDS